MTVTLRRVPSKKRNSRKRNAHRQGLSGNPQRRAEQLRRERVAAGVEPMPPEDREQLLEMAYRLAGGAHPEPWWEVTHGRILSRARALTWPSRLVDVETQVCELVGDEFFDRLNSRGGSAGAQWLRALAEKAGSALRAELAGGGGDWEQLWALLRGLALTTPREPAELLNDRVLEIRAAFRDIKDPYEIAMAEAEGAAVLLAERELPFGEVDRVAGCRLAGKPLVARDVYGSRFLLTAPFAYDGGEPDHWYAWDVDACWLCPVVGAGVFGSADEALEEWRDAVGSAAASGAALSPCSAGLAAWLLQTCLTVGPLAEMLTGFEPRELIREYYRMRRRARIFVDSADLGADEPAYDASHVQEAFLDWYATRHPGTGKEVAEAVGTIQAEWELRSPDERSYYACSPHRIEMTARLIRNGYDGAGPVVELLSEWTQWCIERSGLDGKAAARSLEAARVAAAVPVDDSGDGRGNEDDEGPFRRQE
jgi:hypothetical protein